MDPLREVVGHSQSSVGVQAVRWSCRITESRGTWTTWTDNRQMDHGGDGSRNDDAYSVDAAATAATMALDGLSDRVKVRALDAEE